MGVSHSHIVLYVGMFQGNATKKIKDVVMKNMDIEEGEFNSNIDDRNQNGVLVQPM